MVMESWGANEYRTFITSRRDDVFESRDASAYSSKRVGVSERDVYFDTDAKVPVMRTTLRSVAEFSFNCATPVSPAADDVFNPVYRKETSTFVVSQRTVPELSSRMYQPKYSKFCVNSTDVPPVETAMDSQSSSFRSQTSVGERDTGDSSTTGRDSNGSSNDASSVSTDTTFDRAFDTPTKPSTDRRSVVMDVKTPPPSWTLKWKGIFGSRKPPKLPQPATPPTTTPRPMSRIFGDDKKPKSFLALPAKTSPDARSVLSSDRERERDAGGILRIRERWMKYMRMLRPKPTTTTATSKTMEREPVPSPYVHTRAKSMPAILKTPPLRPRSNPVFTPPAARSSMMPPAGPGSAAKSRKSSSFLAQSSLTSSPRLLSLSPRVSRTSPKVSSSSPRMSSSSNASASSMSELHSSVQGAIAHCKQSHSGLLSPAPHRY